MPNIGQPGCTAKGGCVYCNKPAVDFNDRVWSSPEMAEANRTIEAARVELSAKGWGFVALDQAQAELARAIELIETMKQSERIVISNPVTVTYTRNGRLHA